MATTADTLLDGIEFSERVAGDIAHTTPVFKFFISRTSAAKLLEMVDQVQEHLNEAGDILNDTDSKEALYQVGLYQGLLDELVKRNLVLQKLDSKVKAVKFFNIVGKYALYARVDKEKQIARKFKTKVWSKSTFAQLGFEVANGNLVPPAIPAPPPALPQQLHATPSVATLPAYTAHDESDDGDQDSIVTDVSEASHESHDFEVYSDTDSIHGNPWLGYVVKALARRLSTVSLQSVTSTRHLDDGGERRVENHGEHPPQ